jgi:hypothetical protein
MSFADIWQQADEGDWEPPVGSYDVEIVDTEARVSNAGKPYCKARLRVTKGAHKGQEWDHMMFFSSPTSARISKSSLIMYGLDASAVVEFDDLQRAMPRLVGVTAEVVVKHNNGYVNTDVSRAFTGATDVPAQAEQFAHAPAAADDDEIPY